MYYEICVALNGKHLFATAKRSLTSMRDAQLVYGLLFKKFKKKDGYEITISKNQETGYHLKTVNGFIIFN